MTLDLTSKGYNREELDDIREDINQKFRNRMGDNVATDDAHHFGQFMGAIAAGKDLVGQLAELVYNASSTLRGRDQDLDIVGSDNGISRKPATPATVYLQIDADPGTVIPEGTQYSTEEGIVFNTLEDTKIPGVATVKDEAGQDTPLTDDDGNEIGRVTVQAQANELGVSGNVGAGTITDEGGADGTEGIAGVVRVTNLEPATGGDEIESEINYRSRIMENNLAKSTSTEDGMKAKVENVDGVLQCKVNANDELTVAADGTPPKTTHFYVIGGGDQEVAQAIFDAIGCPGHTYGAISKTVINHSGQERTVNFDRAKTQTVYVQVRVKPNDSWDSDNGTTNLKDKVIEYDRTLEMGDTLLYSKLFEYIWQVSGIESLDLMLGTDKSKLTLGNVMVDAYSLAYITADDIEVIIDD